MDTQAQRAMTDFFRFPHTPHIAWLGEGVPRDDKLLTSAEVEKLLAAEVVIEEKLDGANVGISFGPDGELRAQNRGQYLQAPFRGQFSRLSAWLATHETQLSAVLLPHLMVFGEWCAARHSLDYTELPDWFVVFDVYDREAQRFWNSEARNAFARAAGLHTVPLVMRGRVTVTELVDLAMTHRSCCREGPLEGVVVRRELGEWCEDRGKLVRPDFVQAITTHWQSRAMEWNRVEFG